MKGGRFQFTNIVQEIKERQEEEEEEIERRRMAVEEARHHGRGAGERVISSDVEVYVNDNLPPPSPSLLRRNSSRREDGRRSNSPSRRNTQIFVTPSSPEQDYPGYGGEGYPMAFSRDSPDRASGRYDDHIEQVSRF